MAHQRLGLLAVLQVALALGADEDFEQFGSERAWESGSRGFGEAERGSGGAARLGAS